MRISGELATQFCGTTILQRLIQLQSGLVSRWRGGVGLKLCTTFLFDILSLISFFLLANRLIEYQCVFRCVNFQVMYAAPTYLTVNSNFLVLEDDVDAPRKSARSAYVQESCANRMFDNIRPSQLVFIHYTKSCVSEEKASYFQLR